MRVSAPRFMKPQLACAVVVACSCLGACVTARAPAEGSSSGATAGSGATAVFRAGSDGVVPGIEVLLGDSIHLIRGKRVGLITNHSGRDRSGVSSVDRLFHTPGVRLTALFGPEHGLRGTAMDGVRIGTMVDSATGVTIFSLYGEHRVPTKEMLDSVDVLLYDIQDVGARVYTYEWTMALSAEAATKAGKKFIVLDRPDPVRGDIVQGGVLQLPFRSFVGQFPVALRYGLTPGELIRYLAGTGQIAADVGVVPMRGWKRDQWYDQTRLPRVNPSPNLRSLDAELLYTGIVFFEGTNASEGRGTDAPFEVVGAAWLTDAGAIARELDARGLPGVRFDSSSRSVLPNNKFGGMTIPVITIAVTDRDRVRPVEVGVWMLRTIYAHHQSDWQWRVSHVDRLSGSDALRHAVEESDAAVASLLATWAREAEAWKREASAYWIYR